MSTARIVFEDYDLGGGMHRFNVVSRMGLPKDTEFPPHIDATNPTELQDLAQTLLPNQTVATIIRTPEVAE